MSVTHPHADFGHAEPRGFAAEHPHLAPFLVAVAISVVSVVVSLAVIGLPA
jgi:hypothetical protein